MLICLGVAAIPLDLLIARNFNSQTAGKLHELLVVGEAFGGGAGALVIACLLWAVAPQDRCRIPRLLVAGWGAGITANLIKLMVARMRPFYFLLSESSGTVGDTFRGWLTWGEGGSQLQSFPSAHSAVAFGLLVALLRYYPRARPIFIAIAIAAGLERMLEGAHYLSDVLCGAGVGWLAGTACFKGTWLSLGFDALEHRWSQGLPMDTDAATRKPLGRTI